MRSLVGSMVVPVSVAAGSHGAPYLLLGVSGSHSHLRGMGQAVKRPYGDVQVRQLSSSSGYEGTVLS